MAHLSELLNDPTWFPGELNTRADTLEFTRIDRDSLSSEAFLDQRMGGSVTARQTARLSEVIAELSVQQPPAPSFVFHTAFCCSTLLARALDQRGTAIALKEPAVLMGLANALRIDKQLCASADQVKALVSTIFTLLSRRFTTAECILIKPTNAANNLLPHAIQAGAQVVLLYGDLRSFLISVLKKGEACKSFVRQQYNIFALDANGLAGIPPRQAISFTDLQAAAVVWRHQMELFQRTLDFTRSNQLVSLEFKTLMEAPAPILQAVARHLRLPHSEAGLDLVTQGPVFRHNAKFADQAYDADQRDQDAQVIEERYGETLDVIENWAQQTSLGTELKIPLPRIINT